MLKGLSVEVSWADAYKSLPSSHTTKILKFVMVKHSAYDINSRKEMTNDSARKSMIVEAMNRMLYVALVVCCSSHVKDKRV